ncbi:ComEA family DNA-binding protein [Streptomyces halstedii]|uniref:ComEA family DNA-binding protein n=1 Tax=Streptomyces halstedii TaxID=1944 RepID=UPI0033A8C9C6
MLSPEPRGARPVPSWASAATPLPRRGPVPDGAEASSHARTRVHTAAGANTGARLGTGLRAAGARGSAAGRRPVSEPGVPPTVPPPRPRWWRSVGPALRDRLPLWLQLRCSLEPKSLAALAVVLVGAAVLAGAHFWSARPQTVSAPERVRGAAAEALVPSTDSGVSSSPGSGPEAAGGAPAVGSGGQIVVDVSGKVHSPGIQRLPSGARVADALSAAGGVRKGTDMTGLNRARVLMDGEQVVVGLPGVQPAPGGTAGGGGPTGTGQAGPAAPLSLNTATPEQLETLPGVGPVLAQHIVDYRTEHGGYRSVDELREVNGIGDRRFADLRPLVVP